MTVDSSHLEALLLGTVQPNGATVVERVLDIVPGSLSVLAGVGWGDPGGVYGVTERISGRTERVAAASVVGWRGDVVADRIADLPDLVASEYGQNRSFDIDGAGRLTIDSVDIDALHAIGTDEALRRAGAIRHAARSFQSGTDYLGWAARTIPELATAVDIPGLVRPRPDETFPQWFGRLDAAAWTDDQRSTTQALWLGLRSTAAMQWVAGLVVPFYWQELVSGDAATAVAANRERNANAEGVGDRDPFARF